MGAEKSGMLGASYQTMTTAREAGTILEELRAAGNGLTASLLGWQKEGYGVSPGSLSAAAGVGGKRGLQALSPTGLPWHCNCPSSSAAPRKPAPSGGGTPWSTCGASPW